eukprot:10544342-Heterocapsa_arctica.AAC.1
MAESVFAKHAVIFCRGDTPCWSLFGRSPRLLSEFEAPSISMLDDGRGRDESRYAVRLREIALQSMVQHTI